MNLKEYYAELRYLLVIDAIRQTNLAISLIADIIHPNRIETARRRV